MWRRRSGRRSDLCLLAVLLNLLAVTALGGASAQLQYVAQFLESSQCERSGTSSVVCNVDPLLPVSMQPVLPESSSSTKPLALLGSNIWQAAVSSTTATAAQLYLGPSPSIALATGKKKRPSSWLLGHPEVVELSCWNLSLAQLCRCAIDDNWSDTAERNPNGV
jgi:hypothetical protein